MALPDDRSPRIIKAVGRKHQKSVGPNMRDVPPTGVSSHRPFGVRVSAVLRIKSLSVEAISAACLIQTGG